MIENHQTRRRIERATAAALRDVNFAPSPAAEAFDNLGKPHFWKHVLSYLEVAGEDDYYSGDDADEYESPYETIASATVNGFYIPVLARAITNAFKNEIAGYAMTQILERDKKITEILNETIWDVRITGGYYGDEIDGAIPDAVSLQRLQEYFYPFVGLNSQQLMEQAFLAEYNRLLPSLEGCEYGIARIPADVIQIPGKRQAEILQKRRDEWRQESPQVRRLPSARQPVGVVLFQETNHRVKLVDGYHRLGAVLEAQATGKMEHFPVDVVVAQKVLEGPSL